MNTNFKIGNHEFVYSTVGVGERIIELPLGDYFRKKFANNIVEVGAVLSYHYSDVNHLVVDKFDKNKGCLNIDANDFDCKVKNILSISTVEHMGISEYGEINIDEKHGISFVNKVNRDAKNYLITFPFGFNKKFDELTR